MLRQRPCTGPTVLFSFQDLDFSESNLTGESMLLLQALDKLDISLLRILWADLLIDQLLPRGTLGFLL